MNKNFKKIEDGEIRDLTKIIFDHSMRCIGSLSRSWPEKLAAKVNGVLPYLLRAKN